MIPDDLLQYIQDPATGPCPDPVLSRPALGSIRHPIQWVPVAVCPGAKQQGRVADHSLPSSAKVKNGGAIPPLSIRLHGVVLN
jgi:hypothetical protein